MTAAFILIKMLSLATFTVFGLVLLFSPPGREGLRFVMEYPPRRRLAALALLVLAFFTGALAFLLLSQSCLQQLLDWFTDGAMNAGRFFGRVTDASPWARPPGVRPEVGLGFVAGEVWRTWAWNVLVGLGPALGLALLRWRYAYFLTFARMLVLGFVLSPAYYAFWGWYTMIVAPLVLLELGAYALIAVAALRLEEEKASRAVGLRALARVGIAAAGVLVWASLYETIALYYWL